MRSTTKDPKLALVVGLIVFTLVACGSTAGATGSPSSGGSESSSHSPSNSASGKSSSVPQADPLAGIWQSDPFTAADVDGTVRPQFPGSAVDAWERHDCFPKAGQTVIQVLHFAGGQLVDSSAVNGGSAREGWTASYVVQDSDTFKAGAPDNLYITVDYRIEGDRLFTDLINDDFPDHTPWSDAQDGPGASKLNGVISKPLSDTMCAIEIFEMTPFTRIG